MTASRTIAAAVAMLLLGGGTSVDRAILATPEILLRDDFDDGRPRPEWEIGSNQGRWPREEFVLCGENVGFDDRCAAWSNHLLFDGFWGHWGYDAWTSFAAEPEFYIRWYQYVSDPYAWGTREDKSLLVHDAAATITAYVATSRDDLPGVPASGPGMPFLANYQDVDWQETGGEFTKVNRYQNQAAPITLAPGRWYLFEWYVKLNTPGVSDGETKLWIDDASQPVAQQTLRMHYTDMRWLRSSDAEKRFGRLRLTVYHQRCDGERNTCPPDGPDMLVQSHRWDHVEVSTRPIGPVPPPPVCDGARAVPDTVWPPDHRLVPVGITGVVHPDQESIAIDIVDVAQDEEAREDSGGDVFIQGSTVLLRAERAGQGDGRTYDIRFVARGPRGRQCTGTVSVRVTHSSPRQTGQGAGERQPM